MENQRRTILLTGAGGFLGSRLLCALDRKEFNIIALENRKALERINEKEISRVDILIHCAARTKGSQKEVLEDNLALTKRMIALAQDHRSFFLFISSLNVMLPQKGFYERAKQMGEELLRAAGLKYTIIRPSYLFDDGEEKNLASLERSLPFLRMLRIFPIIPFECKLQPLHVAELVDLCIGCLAGKYSNQTIEIAGPREVSVWEMITKYLDFRGVKVLKFKIPKFLRPMFRVIAGRKLDFFQDKTLAASVNPPGVQLVGRREQCFLR